MPGTITSDQVTIDAADVITNWLALGTWATAPLVNADMNIQGADTVVGRASAAEAWDLATASPAVDLTTGNRHVFVWMKNVTWPGTNTRANGGFKIAISSDLSPTIDTTPAAPHDSPTHGKVWYVGGKDTDSITGWTCYVVDPQSTPNTASGTAAIVLTGVQKVGGGANIVSTIGSGSFKPVNVLFDVVRYGTGLTVTAGTSAAPVAFTDVYTADALNANAFGVVTFEAGIYFGAGKLTFGTAAQAAITYFKDKNQVLVFRAFPVANTFYELVTAGAASFNTTMQLGSFANSVASGGCTIRGSIGVGIGAPGAATAAAAAGAGLSIGAYTYSVTFVNSVGETSAGTEVSVTTTSGNQQVSLTAIPLGATGSGVTGRNIYRTKVGGATGTEQFVASLANNTATTYTDSTADTALGNAVPTLDSTVSSAWTLTASAANTVTNLYACTLSQMRRGALNSGSAMRSCVVSSSGELTPNGAIVDSCTFSNTQLQAPVSGTWALIINATSELANVTNCKFINCNKAIKITVAGTYTLSGCTFSGNTYDIENASTGLVTINATGGSNPVTVLNSGAGASTVINNAVTLTVTCQDTLGNPLKNIRVAIYKSTNITSGQELLQSLTNASGVATASFAFTSNQPIIVRVRGETPTIDTPVNAAFSTASTGGSLSNGTYSYRVSAINDLGETLASTEKSIALSAGTATQTVVVNWTKVPDATGYRIYGRSAGAELFIAAVGAVGTYTDLGSVTPSGALPSTNTTMGGRYFPVDASGSITSSGFSTTFTLVTDTIASTAAL